VGLQRARVLLHLLHLHHLGHSSLTVSERASELAVNKGGRQETVEEFK
jgi:hypothetical protein